ncbi:MAG: peptidylprolyl isomerase [Planctomycetota bacterium]|nr:peptidylprolyl isomerase [Planctomycetota bacterium]
MRMLMLSAAALFLLNAQALGQLTPDRTYYGINRAMPMTVRIPRAAAPASAAVPLTNATAAAPAASPASPDEPAKSTGDAPTPADKAPPAAPVPSTTSMEAVIELFLAEDAKPISSAPVIEGRVDMAALFPELWTATPARLLYAQLRVGSGHVGSPVVLQPMVTAPTATLLNTQTRQAWFADPVTGTPNYDARKQCELIFNTPLSHYSGIRAYVEQQVVFETSEGEIEFQMVNNLLELVRGGFFTDTIVHRVVPRLPATGHPFVVQFGDPTGTGDGGPGYAIDLEQSRLPHDFGVLSMARDDHPDTNGSQVFICLSREGTSRLDGKYTAFAQAVRGEDVIMKLGSVKTDEKTQRPLSPPRILSARLVPAPPVMQRPRPVVRPAANGR